MIELLQRLKRLDHDGNLMEGVAQLAAKEREVRTLEMAIEYISSLEDEDLARVWPRLMAAIYSSSERTASQTEVHAETVRHKIGRLRLPVVE